MPIREPYTQEELDNIYQLCKDFADTKDDVPLGQYKDRNQQFTLDYISVEKYTRLCRVSAKTGIVQITDDCKDCDAIFILFICLWGFMRITVGSDVQADSCAISILKEKMPSLSKSDVSRIEVSLIDLIIDIPTPENKERIDAMNKYRLEYDNDSK